jgi:transcriptional regulator with XRE-family HTH domain
MTIGDKIRKVREIKGLKQEWVAGQLGLSVTAYGNLERGDAGVTVERLEEIAKVLEVNALEIMGLSDHIVTQHFNNGAGSVGVGYNYGPIASSEVEAYKTLVEEQKTHIAQLQTQITHLQAQVDRLTDVLIGKI